jgi:hypothetical protein
MRAAKPSFFQKPDFSADLGLGANERGSATPSLAGLVEASCGCHAQTHLGFNVSVAHVWADQEYELEKAGKRMPVESKD